MVGDRKADSRYQGDARVIRQMEGSVRARAQDGKSKRGERSHSRTAPERAGRCAQDTGQGFWCVNRCAEAKLNQNRSTALRDGPEPRSIRHARRRGGRLGRRVDVRAQRGARGGPCRSSAAGRHVRLGLNEGSSLLLARRTQKNPQCIMYEQRYCKIVQHSCFSPRSILQLDRKCPSSCDSHDEHRSGGRVRKCLCLWMRRSSVLRV